MYNLPTDSAINDCIVFHEGNHDDRTTQHENYISKWNYCSTSNNGALTNKWTKIAKIEWEGDTNTGLFYVLKLFTSKNNVITKIYLTLGINGVISYSYSSNSYYQTKLICNAVGTSSIGKPLYELSLYIQIFNSYNPIFYMLEVAKNTEVSNYPNDYAYRCIELLSSQEFLDSISETHSPIDLTIKEFTNSITWGIVSVVAGTTYTITINDSNVKWNSIVGYSTSIPMPDGLILQNAQLKSGGGGFYVKVTNITTGLLSFPACTIAYKIRQI